MHVQRAAQAADHHEQFGEIRVLGEQFGELVEHHEQCGQRVEVGTRGTRLLVFGDIGEVARLTQHFLAAVHFTGQGIAHAVDEVGFLFQVGNDGRDVRNTVQTEEGRTTLEVDQHQVQLVRRMRGQQTEHQGAQEFRLTGTGCADAQSVRTHTAFGGFLDIEFDGRAVGADTEGHAQPLAAVARTPGVFGIEGTDIAELHQLGPGRDHFGVIVFDIAAALGRGTIRRESARDLLGLLRADPVDEREALLVAGRSATDTFTVLDDHLDTARNRQTRCVAAQVDNGHAFVTGFAELVLFGLEQAAIDDDDDMHQVGVGGLVA